jgi:hypothetical protein
MENDTVYVVVIKENSAIKDIIVCGTPSIACKKLSEATGKEIRTADMSDIGVALISTKYFGSEIFIKDIVEK